MRINKANIIFSEKALQKHKRVEEKKKKIGDVLHVIKDKKQQEENVRIKYINYIENRGRFAVLDDESSNDEYDVVHLKIHKSPQNIPIVKTCTKTVSFVDKKAHELLQKKKERQNAYIESIYGYWPMPTIKDIIKGRRSFLDYPDNALLYELTDIPAGWSIYMEFMEGRLSGGRIGVIENAINNARRKRRWVWSPEEHERITREEAEAEQRAEEERICKLKEEKEAVLRIEEERVRKLKEEEKERLRQIQAAKEEAERRDAELYASIKKCIQESIYYNTFNEYLHIPGGWGYLADVLDSGYRHPVQSSISYFTDSDSNYQYGNDSDSESDSSTDIEDFMDCNSDIE